MAELRCADGTVLGVHPEPVLDRHGAPYEVTLRLERDGQPFGRVGERCGYFLAAATERLRAALARGGAPASSTEDGVRAWALNQGVDPDAAWAGLERHLPRDRELCAFRSRDPDDLTEVGELRVRLEAAREWVPSAGDEPGTWRLHRCAVVEAWGPAGTGVRAALSLEELLVVLDELGRDVAAVGADAGPAATVPAPVA